MALWSYRLNDEETRFRGNERKFFCALGIVWPIMACILIFEYAGILGCNKPKIFFCHGSIFWRLYVLPLAFAQMVLWKTAVSYVDKLDKFLEDNKDDLEVLTIEKESEYQNLRHWYETSHSHLFIHTFFSAFFFRQILFWIIQVIMNGWVVAVFFCGMCEPSS